METLDRIADLLCDYRRAKADAKEYHAEMMKIAVEELGMDQADASKTDIASFLDGYLVGQGMQQSWRNVA